MSESVQHDEQCLPTYKILLMYLTEENCFGLDTVDTRIILAKTGTGPVEKRKKSYMYSDTSANE